MIALHHLNKANGHRQKGFSMIEALIAFAVLSFGIMGVVTLLASSKANQFETVQRTRAVTLGNSLVERIRINPSAIATYHTGLDAPIEVDVDRDAEPEPAPNCISATCTPLQLAQHDLWEWREEFRGATAQITASGDAVGGLLEPKACVVFDADPGRASTGALTIIVSWRGLLKTRDAAAGGDECGALATGTEEYRRQVAIQTYIVDETEL